jgi:3-hydroxyacyl-[acyl-carrier-protein] dehydratase
MDRAAIEAAIPHRPPFLFVDRVAKLCEDQIVSEWDVDPGSAFFAGHYPGHPLVPGVLINEFVFQSAAILMSGPTAEEVAADAVPVLTGVKDARFMRMVRPGEVLRAVVTLTERLGPACYMKARVTSAGRSVARLTFVVALKAPEVAP